MVEAPPLDGCRELWKSLGVVQKGSILPSEVATAGCVNTCDWFLNSFRYLYKCL